ncbi:MAG: AraC family transcriptional regulator [Gammaproteobacteria bacterium]|nr:MAG: AraC family transcriptional regulator [Gammaproteobacteria bacterium]
MIQLQRNFQNRALTEDELLKSEIVTYAEYLALSVIPAHEGTKARVVDALRDRVGRSHLSVGEIAEDLGLSKRTLQRRLKKEDANFAQLRDSLRFHYAIKYIVQDGMNVDSVSKALDFSDRTSFNTAFKRWTALSPSVFRRLYRDYA